MFIYQTIIFSTADKIWNALTDPEITRKFWFGVSVISDWHIYSDIKLITEKGKEAMKGKVL
jgi:hypothetical protein